MVDLKLEDPPEGMRRQYASLRDGIRSGHADNFQTPPDALLPILPYIPTTWTVWEPAAGKGNISRAFLYRGNQVQCSDLHAPGGGKRDFLTWTPPCDYDCIVTNPPFTIKDKFLARCYELGKPFALLMPLAAFQRSQRHQKREHGMELIVLPARVHFKTPSGRGSGAWFPTAWFTHGLGIGSPLTFWTPETAQGGLGL